MLDRVMAGAKNFYKAQGQAVPRKGSKRHRALQDGAIQVLVQREMYAQRAQELGITVTAKQIDDRRKLNDEQMGALYTRESDKREAERLREAMGDVSDVDVFRDSIRDQLVHEALYRKVTALRGGEIEALVANPLSEEVRHELSIAAQAWNEWEEKLRDEFADAIYYAPGYAPREPDPEPEEPEWFDVPAEDLDELTGLYNRRALEEAFEQEASDARRDNRPLALVLLDIKNLFGINDVFGHTEGDLVLREVARRIRKVVGPSLKAYRIGGDEFAIIVSGSTADADKLVNLLHGGISRRKIGEAGRVHLSSGVTEFLGERDASTWIARTSMRMGAEPYSPEKLDEALRETARKTAFPIFALDLATEEIWGCRLLHHPADTDQPEFVSLSYELALRFAGYTMSASVFVHETAAESESEQESFRLNGGSGEHITGEWGNVGEIDGQSYRLCFWNDDKQGPTMIRFERKGTQITLRSLDVTFERLVLLLRLGVFRRVEG